MNIGKFLLLCGTVVTAAPILFGQATGPSTAVNQRLPKPTPYAVITRGANQNVWERTVYEQGPNGTIIPIKHHYTELASGLNYQDPATGAWTPSKEEIDILPDGTAAATQGQHQVYFPADIYNGVIEVVTPDGKHLKSRPLGISYDDGNNTVLISQLKDSVGEIISVNQVMYPDVFTDFKADLVYTYRKGSFEQDVVLHEQPPAPQSLGLNPQSTRLQLLTEFFNTADPKQKALSKNAQSGLQDMTLTFGSMKMVQGKAFSMGGSRNNSAQNNQSRLRSAANSQTPTYKSWQKLAGRTFLVEELPVEKLAAQLNALPVSSASLSLNSKLKIKNSKLVMVLPPMRLAESSTNKMQLALAGMKPKSGVVLDYVEIDADQTNFTFQGDTTYYISSGLNLSGVTTIEGGAVLKYNGSGQVNIDSAGTIVCLTGENPAIFTSFNDNSVGETISGSSGTPATVDVNTFLNVNNVTLSNLRFYYGEWPLSGTGEMSACQAILKNCQFFYGNTLYVQSAQIFNNLFVGMNYLDWLPSADNSFVQNNTFVNLWVILDYGDFTPVVVSDNLFDSGSVSDWTTYGSTGGNNAFYNMADYLGPYATGLPTDTTYSGEPGYETGPLGDYYLPSDSPLIDAGDTTADQLGLYHFTTQTSQTIEGFSTVDIGYHYVATDDSGNPLDSNGDGIPDYLEDANGNGIFDVGDLGDWLVGPSNGLSRSNGLSVFTPLK